MNGACYRAAAKTEGDLAFGGNGRRRDICDDGRRAVKRLVVAGPIVSDGPWYGEIIECRVALREDRCRIVARIGLGRAGHDAHDAHAADQLQHDKPSHETAENAVHGRGAA